MEDNKKKPIFEPVSAEEAKKIRAFKEGISPKSGTVDCGSGFHDSYASCATKNYGEACCLTLPNGENVIGYCANNINSESGTTDGTLKCITNPTEVPDRPILPPL